MVHLSEAPSGRAVPGLWHVATSGRRLAAARQAVPTILAELRQRVPAAAAWQASPGVWTSTGTAVFSLGDGGDVPAAVLRLSGGSGLRRESQVFEALAALPLDAERRRLLPQRVAVGSVPGFSYAADLTLPGRSADLAVCVEDWPPTAEAALDWVGALHRSSAELVTVDAAALDRWVDQPLRVVKKLCGGLPGTMPPARIERLRVLLREALDSRRVHTSWVHGDYWAGNLLVDGDARLTGVVDWDLAAPDELPIHDYLHLLLYRRTTVTGRDLGDVVRDLIGPAAVWSTEEQQALTRADWVFEGEPPARRVLVLLYWLRHVAAISVQQRSYVTHSVRVWQLRNVHRVLRSL